MTTSQELSPYKTTVDKFDENLAENDKLIPHS
jgi:hypothetical protein